jgi:hypothetical protein
MIKLIFQLVSVTLSVTLNPNFCPEVYVLPHAYGQCALADIKMLQLAAGGQGCKCCCRRVAGRNPYAATHAEVCQLLQGL